MARPRPRAGVLAAGLLILTLAGCRITWREPEIQPLDPSRVFAIDTAAACDEIAPVLTQMGRTIASSSRERTSCLFETDELRLSGQGEPANHLDRVAYVGNQSFFSHGRSRLTVSARPGTEGVVVRVISRIEGYDAGYRVLRSTGLLEQTFFDRLAGALGVDPGSN